MKSARLLILAFFLPGLMSIAQENQTAAPASQPAPAAQAPATPDAATPAPTQTQPPALAAGAAAETYVIGPSDTVTVSVWKEQTLSGPLLVRPDGMITMALIGDVQASGLTPPQLADSIETKLKKFMQDPKVSVVVGAIHSKVIYLLGEVGKRGPIEMTPGMTLLQAIGAAGGITDYGNPKKIYILRDENGNHQKIPVHYKDALKGNSADDLLLKSGDTIVVP
jgi:polysaccharide export outer membrane protein